MHNNKVISSSIEFKRFLGSLIRKYTLYHDIIFVYNYELAQKHNKDMFDELLLTFFDLPVEIRLKKIARLDLSMELLSYIVQIVNSMRLDTKELEIIKTVLYYFPEDFIDSILNIIKNKNLSLYTRMFFVESIAILDNITSEKTQFKVLNLLKEIEPDNSLLFDFLKETVQGVR